MSRERETARGTECDGLTALLSNTSKKDVAPIRRDARADQTDVVAGHEGKIIFAEVGGRAELDVYGASSGLDSYMSAKRRA